MNYNPNPHYFGSDIFTVAVSDDLGGTTFQDITIDVIDDGYDANGFDSNGFDRDGYDVNGFNIYGFDTEGLNLGYYLCDEDGNPIDYLSVLGNQADNVYTLKI